MLPPIKRTLLTAREAADYLGVQVQTLAVWRSRNKRQNLPFVRVGKAIRYRLADLERWIDERTVSPPAK